MSLTASLVDGRRWAKSAAAEDSGACGGTHNDMVGVAHDPQPLHAVTGLRGSRGRCGSAGEASTGMSEGSSHEASLSHCLGHRLDRRRGLGRTTSPGRTTALCPSGSGWPAAAGREGAGQRGLRRATTRRRSARPAFRAGCRGRTSRSCGPGSLYGGRGEAGDHLHLRLPGQVRRGRTRTASSAS